MIDSLKRQQNVNFTQRMNKYILLTGYDDAMAYIGHLTSPLMLAYASRYGMDFKCTRNYEKDSHPSWQKVNQILLALSHGYTAVLWLDADTVITNFALAPWKKCASGMHVSQDWGSNAGETHHFSLGNLVAHHDTIPLWEEVLKRTKKWANAPLWEQSCLQELYIEQDWVREKITVLPRRCYNAVPRISSTATVIAKEPWLRGDWLCHLTNLYPQQRIKAFYDLLPHEYVIGLNKTDYEQHLTAIPPQSTMPLTSCLPD